MTSRRMRVAVIDSGVHVDHPHIGGIAGGISIGAAGEMESDAFADRLGHGTAVMAAIQEKAPGADYFAIKVFHTALRTTADCLLRALEWAIEHRMDVVNLSLGTPNARRAADFQRLASQGVLLVSARESNGQLCYPGCLPEVIGVSLDWECPRDRFRVDDSGFYASGYPRPIPGVAPERNLNGISFAVANMTGFIVGACQGLPERSPATLRMALSNASAP